MDMERLVIVLILTFWVIVDAYTGEADFDYTLCRWYNSRCIQTDKLENIYSERHKTKLSDWPPGPYALLTPSEGCPELGEMGWRRGYLSFIWKHPQTLTLVSDCKINNKSNHSDDEKWQHAGNASNSHSCLRSLTSDKWPHPQSHLLGPFNMYEWRLNFCFKPRNKSINENQNVWPSGSYSIFGDANSCPSGFTTSERKIKLPAITAWKSNGHLPSFSIKTEETDNSVLLVLKMCERQIVENETNGFNVSGTFILIKNTDNSSCPQIDDMNAEAEALQLHTEINDSVEITNLFHICYFRPETLLTDLDNYLYMPKNSLPKIVKTDFSLLNPTLIYGNRTSPRVSNTLNNDFSRLTLPQNYEETTTPRLLVDFGRHLIVVGLQFKDHFLTESETSRYSGSLDRTLHGYVCQRWDEQEPHSHNFTYEEQYPDKTVSDAENHCRDPSVVGKIWCYTDSPNQRWDYCAEEVYNFKEEDRPFSQCYISGDRWRIDEFGGISCRYTVSYKDGLLYLQFLRNYEGRYVKLVGKDDIENSQFYSSTINVQVLTSDRILYDEMKCNTDLGMGDGSILDHQITASSWQSQSPPTSGRPFSSGWCAKTSDTNPYISVDLMSDTIVEGITFFNWELADKHIVDGIYTKKFMIAGSKKVQIHYSTENNTIQTNMTYNFDMFLPTEKPQTYYHSSILTRYIAVYIMESMTPSSKCLRFELHGCKRHALPDRVATERTLAATRLSGEESISFGNLKILKENSVINSIAYPTHYSGGLSYSWIVYFPKGKYIQFIFTDMSLNIYQPSVWNQCHDKLSFLPTYTEDSLYLDEQFNGLVFLVETNLTYLTLTFTTCRPVMQMKSVGSGFEAIVRSKGIPTCFSARRNTEKLVHNYCSQPTMFLTSLSRLNFPVSNAAEQWTIHVKKFSIHLKILYFSVRCDSGSSLTITDRFSGGSTFCNLKKPKTEWHSNSDTVHIRYEKGRILGRTFNGRISARDGFQVLYRTFHKSMSHLIDLQKTHVKAVLKIAELENYWNPVWKNATLLVYQGCSKKFGKCYDIYSGAITSWIQAGQECWIRHSRLVSTHSDEEQELIKYILRNFRFVDLGKDTLETAFPSNKTDPNYFSHIGLSRVTSETGMKLHIWEDGSPVTFSAWKEGEPSTNGDCTRMSFHLFNTNNTWESENCETGLANYFICEHRLTDDMFNTLFSHMYNGTLNVTLSGLDCQRWDAQYPHSHRYNKDHQFPELSVSDAENYCRDPGRDGYIWCYTTDPVTRYEKCSEVDSPTSLYTGKLSRTSSGRTCQRWDSHIPHSPSYKMLSLFPDDSFEELANHCRDPSYDGILWCYTTDPNRRWETCNLKDTAEDRCYLTHSSYSGLWNMTRSGIACQPWKSVLPHDHELFLDSQFPDGSVAEAHNYCRDPYNEGFLWCFTMDPATKYEPCSFDYKYQLKNFTMDLVNTNKTALCSNGEEISWVHFCDGIPNCSDLSDEANCTTDVHQLMLNRTLPDNILDTEEKYSLFQCESKEWVSMFARCDSVIDCIDASDEMNCSLSQEKSICSKNEYACDDSGCIHVSQMCDFIVDCMDGSDENCDFPLCWQKEYRCRNQQCIPGEDRCNAYEDCLDGSDEENCDVCKDNSFHCDLTRCIPKRLVCDKYVDCKDETDETACGQPLHYSCEEWWNAGYRKNGVYKLNETVVECNFDAVNKEGTVYTIFHNFEVTSTKNINLYGLEQIHFGDKDSLNSAIISSHFQNNSYNCIQNITQSCIPAYEAFSDYRNHTLGNASDTCVCVTITVAPYRYDTDNSSLHFCGNERPMTDNDHNYMLFQYFEEQTQFLDYEGERGMEITVGPIVCSNDRAVITGKPFGKKNNALNGQVRCVFDIDSAGFVIGSRSGQHLQECEHFSCPTNTVKCPGSFCLPVKFICDGKIQCPGGQDEEECGCQDADREVVFLYEDLKSKEETQKIKKMATQFYTPNSIVRELRYRETIRPEKLHFDHRFLDMSDTVINPYSSTNREFTCNYSILASQFVNRIEFSKKDSRGILFFQERNESDVLTEMMFAKIKSRPEFLIYRIIQDPFYENSNLKSFQVVTDIVVKSWEKLAAIGAKYFPELCKEARTVICPNEYKCSASKTCIPLEQICDGQTQCLNGDDERFCHYSCPENCTCVEYTTDCGSTDVDNKTLPYLHNNSRLLELSGNTGLREILLSPMSNFPYLISLNLSMCELKEMAKDIFQSMGNLRILDLSYNKLTIIPSSAFIGLRKLKVLNLLGNKDIYMFQPYSFNGLSSIRKIEITSANIHKISSHTFSGLNLDELKLSDNNIHELEDNVFSGMNVKIIDMENNKITIFNKGFFRGASGITSLHTPAFKYCCVRPNYLADTDCFPEKDEFSSCADLLRVSALQTMLWLIGILALVGNILSVIYRLVYDRERLKLGFGIFVTNLAVADFLMGIYLIIIAVADAAYRKRYTFMDDYWRNSGWCTLAGFLSTASSEASVFFLCLITIDRLLVIKYPFGQIRFNPKNAGISSGIVWVISVSVSLIPILYKDYFQDKFYSKSGVCIALPLTRDRPPGWLYSIMIFIGLNFVTFCLIAIGQVIIYREIKKATAGIRRSSTRKGKGGSGRRRELTVARNLFLVVTTDFLCWFPIGLMGMMAMSGYVIPGEVYAWTAVFILPINSALNPVLYTLTAFLGKRVIVHFMAGVNQLVMTQQMICRIPVCTKAQAQQDTQMMTSSYRSPVRVRKTRPFKGLFRYFIAKTDGFGQTFISLDDLDNKDITLTSKDVLTCVRNLSHCLCLLHRNSLLVKLDGRSVYVSVSDGKVIGDIQIRQEPSECSNNGMKQENMHQLGQVVRRILVISQKTRKRHAECNEKQSVSTEEHN
ncbi:uncharacterized protein LOC123526988 isoform X2 [Mercenaria mercenaria]|uniref:uncharacterized protein LOC123526988 isoform X2 n=1 Tax=Mercenaria mercenaria TaxID=6596 RepID=UPI00234F7A7B|nr:uncharacterized protein LOC123526988 isoform X2 [Mercenaria mercenaria]